MRAFIDPGLGFAGPPIEIARPARATLADLIALVPLHNEALRPHLRVKLGGEIIDPALYHRILPKVDAFVSIVLPVHGGKNGILGTLAVIALVGASVFVGAAGLPFLGSAFAAGSVGANLVAGGLSLAASLLLQGLNTPQAAGNSSSKEIGVASAQNSFEPGAYLQRVAGTRKVTPQMVMPPFSQLDGDDQLVTTVYGLSGPHQIEGIKVGSAEVAGLTDIEYEVREGFSSDTDLTLVTDTRIEVPVNLRLSQFRMEDSASATYVVDTSISPYTPQWHRVQTKRAPDSARLFLTFEAGLIFSGNSGPEPANCAVHLRIRQRGTLSWYNLPEFIVRGQKASGALRLSVDFNWLATADMPSSVTAFSASYGGWRAMFQTVERTATSTNYWSANAYFATNKVDYLSKQQLAIYLNTATFPQSDAYEIEVMRGYSASDAILTFNSAVQHTITGSSITHYDFFSSVLSGGQQKIPPTTSAYVDGLLLPAIQSIWNEYPFDFTDQPTALIAIRARNRSLDQVTCVASGYVPDWDGATWVADQVTSNPASHYRDVLRGELNAEPVPDSLIDSEMLQDWHEWCASEGWEVNAILQGQPVDQCLSLIAQSGMARPKFGAVYGVVIDRPREPVGLITQRNASGFAFQKPFGRLPHALRVNLSDEDADYEVREVVVYDDGYNADGSGGLIEASRFESVTYQGLTAEVLVTRRALRDMRFARWRSRLITFSVDIEHLEYQLGDLVLLETDILGQMGGRGRVKAITTSAGLLTGLKFDEQRDFTQADADGAQRAVAMRLMDGTVRIEQVTADDSDLSGVVFKYPFSMPTSGGDDMLVVGTLLATGTLDAEARKVLIWDIAPGPDLTAQITAIDYAEAEVYRQTSSRVRFDGIGALSAAGVRVKQRAASMAGVGSLAAARLIRRNRASTMAGVGSLAAAPKAVHNRSVAFAGIGSLAARPDVVLTRIGYGHVNNTGSTNLNLSYGTVDNGSGPSVGDLAVWHCIAGTLSGDTTVDLSGSGWTQVRAQVASGGYWGAFYAKVLTAGDISSPPQWTNSPASSIGFWVVYRPSQPITALAVSALTQTYGGAPAPADITINMSAVAAPIFFSTIGQGTDDSVLQAWAGATPDVTNALNGVLSGGTDDTHRFKRYAAAGFGNNVTVSKGDDGSANLLSGVYLTIT